MHSKPVTNLSRDLFQFLCNILCYELLQLINVPGVLHSLIWWRGIMNSGEQFAAAL